MSRGRNLLFFNMVLVLWSGGTFSFWIGVCIHKSKSNPVQLQQKYILTTHRNKMHLQRKRDLNLSQK